MQMTQPKIFTRGKKLWIRFTLDGDTIKKSLNLDNTKANIKLANTQIIPQMIIKVHSGEFFEKNENKSLIPTLNEYQKISFDNHRHERKETTNTDYLNTYNKHIKPYFGDKNIDQIKVSDINKWKNMLFSKLNLSSLRVNAIKKILGTILEDAFLDEVINKNPVRQSKPLPSHTAKEIEPFSKDEVSIILNSCNGQEQNLIATLFLTGIRTGELIGLKWEDIDFINKNISIKRTIGRGIIGSPKTSSSIRNIPIFNILLPYLENQYNLTGKYNSFIFLNSQNNHFFDAKNIRDGLWKKVLKKAQIKYRTVYQTRHTFCSINLQSGTDLIWISKMMGHKNPKITLERYSKYIPINNDYSSVFDSVI